MPTGDGPPVGDDVPDDAVSGDGASDGTASIDDETVSSRRDEDEAVPGTDGSAGTASRTSAARTTAAKAPDGGDTPGGGGPEGVDPETSGRSAPGTAEPTGHDSQPPGASDGSTGGRRGRREVEVPQSLFRIVTVFSTLLSIVLVVAGFTVMTMATTIAENPPASLVVQVLALVVPTGTLVDHRTSLALGVGLAGLALIACGAGVYVYGSRFRTPGMGKSKDRSDEDSNDG